MHLRIPGQWKRAGRCQDIRRGWLFRLSFSVQMTARIFPARQGTSAAAYSRTGRVVLLARLTVPGIGVVPGWPATV